MPHNFPPNTVILAEKPSVASDIAKVLGMSERKDGYFLLDGGAVSTFAYGHLLEGGLPEDYDPALKAWRWDTLPWLPTNNILKPRDKAKAQLAVIGALLKKAPLVILATDAGREGELIGREILTWHKYTGPVKRLWLQATTAKDIQQGFNNLIEGRDKEPLWKAALARAEADKLYGINATRGATLALRQPKTVYPVGRVQTPTLYLVVKRMKDIAAFKGAVYYELEAEVVTDSGKTLTLSYAPDEANRITDKKEAERLMRQADEADGPLSVSVNPGKESPPLPHTLSSLQQEANRVLSLSAQKTLDVAQALYDKKAISYPRTPCPYLSEALKGEVPGILNAVRASHGSMVKQLLDMGTVLRGSLFDDSKLEDHHGIIPKSAVELSGIEAQVFDLIAKRFLQSIAPDCEFERTVISMDANGVPLKTTGKQIHKAGWRSFDSKSAE
jgi:DNA topoisomerase-3